MNLIKKIKWWVKSNLENLDFLSIYNSPFKRPTIHYYFGRIKYGVPYFYPRRWVKFNNLDRFRAADRDCNNKNHVYYGKDPLAVSRNYRKYLKAIPKKIGFDFVPLRWKTKWHDKDIRYESNPIWSFVFFNFQICVMWIAPHDLWELFLHYRYRTDKNKTQDERLKEITISIKKDYLKNK